MSYTVRPISDRTAFTGKHQRSPFSATWLQTENLLLHEVRQLRGRDLVVECDVPESQIRIDGGLYARATPATPAIRVAFTSMHGPLTYATDRFLHWQDNVRAIALGLEALRRVDRYGITKRGEQYAGWKQLPVGSGNGASHMTRSEAAAVIERVAIGDDEGYLRDRTIARLLADPDLARQAWREARKIAHPDRCNGDHTVWNRVEQAARVLGVSPR